MWLLEGNAEIDIREAIAAKFPDEDGALLLVAAMDHLQAVGNADKSVIRGWCLEAYRELYRRMLDIGDYNNAAKIVKELMRLSS